VTTWIAIFLLALLASVLLAWPLLRARRHDGKRLDHDLAVYRAQLQELEQDVDNGSLSEEMAVSAKREIERRMLKAADRHEELTGPKQIQGGTVTSVAIVLLIASGSLALYTHLGSPHLASAPIQQAVPHQVAGDDKMDDLAVRLATRLAAEPDDLRGWVLLGRTYATLNRPAEAAGALSKAIKLDPKDARLRANLGQMLVQSGGGTVSSAALVAFRKANELDSNLVSPVYYIGLHDFQQSKPQSAYDRWLALYRRLPADDPVRPTILNALMSAGQQLGIDVAKEQGIASAAPPLNNEQAAAARDMSPEDQQAFIKSMVARLAEKLTENPDDLEGWMRLGRAYTVLENWPQAGEAYQNANRLKPADPEILALWARAIANEKPNDPVPEAAIEIYRQIEKIAPDDGEALWYLGLSEAEKGDTAAALRHWRKLLAQIPTDTSQHNTLATAIKRLEEGKSPFGG